MWAGMEVGGPVVAGEGETGIWGAEHSVGSPRAGKETFKNRKMLNSLESRQQIGRTLKFNLRGIRCRKWNCPVTIVTYLSKMFWKSSTIVVPLDVLRSR